MARFVRQRAGEEFAAAWWFYYDTSDHLWACIEGHGDYNSGSAVMSDCVYDSAAEYRYDGGRARYLVRPRDPTTLDLTGGSGVSPEELAAVGAWRDYDGDSIYGDYTVSLNSEGGSPAEQTAITDDRAFLAGVGYADIAGGVRYEHSDQIGTVRAITEINGTLSDPPDPVDIIAASDMLDRAVGLVIDLIGDYADPPPVTSPHFGYLFNFEWFEY